MTTEIVKSEKRKARSERSRTVKSKNRILSILISLFFTLNFSLFTSHAVAQKAKAAVSDKPLLTRIEFLFDASNSMFGRWQTGTKIEIARKLMNNLMDSLRYVSNIEVALRVFGHQKPFPPQDCDDSRLEVPFTKGNFTTIQKVLTNVVPRGTTPIAKSLELCGNDFPQELSRNIIILITDGIEECGGDPCAVSAALQKKGIFLKPFVIGLSLDENLKKTFDCVGRFYDAANEVTFKSALNIVISQALNATSLQVNLLDINHNPTETNVNMTFYDQFTGEMRYNFIHTLNSRGLPDTLIIDPMTMYRIVVHTTPPVSKDSIEHTPGKHTVVGIDAPQGYLTLKINGLNDYRKLQAVVRKQNELQTLTLQDFNSTQKYIVGKYDLEIMTLPRTYVYAVDISQSKTTTVDIPQPGLASFISNSSGYGSIFLDERGKLKWLYNLTENQTKETLTLQPGDYHVVYRPKASRESIYTIEKSFKIESGKSVAIMLY